MARLMRFMPVAIALLLQPIIQGSARAPSPIPPAHDRVLIYVMSYDNNLAPHGPGILRAIGRGVRDSDTVATVLADDPDPRGLNRIVIRSDGVSFERQSTDNSASEDVLGDYLSWASKTYPAKRYAIIFLNHGGRLYEMCSDQNPGNAGAKRWMDGRLVGEKLRAFRASVPGSVDLVYLQQCGRASVENLYNFHDTASVVLSSQHVVGAPNTYYEPTFQWLGSHPDATGRGLATRIMDDDRHFRTYVCVDGKSLAELPHRLGPVVDALIDHDTKITRPQGLSPCFTAGGEEFFDLMEWLGAAYRENGRRRLPLDDFADWMRRDLILRLVAADGKLKTCGLSLFVPQSGDQVMRYRDDPGQKASQLDRLHKALGPPVTTR